MECSVSNSISSSSNGNNILFKSPQCPGRPPATTVLGNLETMQSELWHSQQPTQAKITGNSH